MPIDYPSNKKLPGEKAPETEAKKVEKVVVNSVTRRKKSLGKRFTDIFVGGDSKSVWDYVIHDVLVPAAKDMVTDAVSQGVERLVFGDTRPNSRRRAQGKSGTYYNYNRVSSGGRSRSSANEPSRPQISRRGRATHDFDEIVLETRAEADEVLERLYDLTSQYDSASVSDLYDLVGISPNYTDGQWGWTNLKGTNIVRVRGGGYLIDLPRPESLD